MWKMTRGLYLGDRKDAYDLDLLRGHGITHIVNCAAEVRCPYRSEFRYLALRMTDPDERFHEHIDSFCKFIHGGRKAGGVLVHCRAGLSRSPSVILAYFCWRGKALDEALDLMRRRIGETEQDFIEPDASFLSQIEVYFEDEEHGGFPG